MRIGIGYDVHRFAENRDLIIGGVKIEYEYGLEGHSDADVLVHSIMDAILGAAGLKDIGHQFPPNDMNFKNIDSMLLLDKVRVMLEQLNLKISYVDSVIIAENPKFMDYIDSMRRKISSVLKINSDRVNVKATTTEKLGFTGRSEGIAAEAVVLLEEQLEH